MGSAWSSPPLDGQEDLRVCFNSTTALQDIREDAESRQYILTHHTDTQRIADAFFDLITAIAYALLSFQIFALLFSSRVYVDLFPGNSHFPATEFSAIHSVQIFGVSILFISFIASCGITHLLVSFQEAFQVHLHYSLTFIKLVCAVVSLATALLLAKLIPATLRSLSEIEITRKGTTKSLLHHRRASHSELSGVEKEKEKTEGRSLRHRTRGASETKKVADSGWDKGATGQSLRSDEPTGSRGVIAHSGDEPRRDERGTEREGDGAGLHESKPPQKEQWTMKLSFAEDDCEESEMNAEGGKQSKMSMDVKKAMSVPGFAVLPPGGGRMMPGPSNVPPGGKVGGTAPSSNDRFRRDRALKGGVERKASHDSAVATFNRLQPVWREIVRKSSRDDIENSIRELEQQAARESASELRGVARWWLSEKMPPGVPVPVPEPLPASLLQTNTTLAMRQLTAGCLKESVIIFSELPRGFDERVRRMLSEDQNLDRLIWLVQCVSSKKQTDIDVSLWKREQAKKEGKSIEEKGGDGEAESPERKAEREREGEKTETQTVMGIRFLSYERDPKNQHGWATAATATAVPPGRRAGHARPRFVDNGGPSQPYRRGSSSGPGRVPSLIPSLIQCVCPLSEAQLDLISRLSVCGANVGINEFFCLVAGVPVFHSNNDRLSVLVEKAFIAHRASGGRRTVPASPNVTGGEGGASSGQERGSRSGSGSLGGRGSGSSSSRARLYGSSSHRKHLMFPISGRQVIELLLSPKLNVKGTDCQGSPVNILNGKIFGSGNLDGCAFLGFQKPWEKGRFDTLLGPLMALPGGEMVFGSRDDSNAEGLPVTQAVREDGGCIALKVQLGGTTAAKREFFVLQHLKESKDRYGKIFPFIVSLLNDDSSCPDKVRSYMDREGYLGQWEKRMKRDGVRMDADGRVPLVCIAIGFASGGDLEAFLDDPRLKETPKIPKALPTPSGPSSRPTLQKWLMQSLAGLHFLGEEGYVNLDIKEANILLDSHMNAMIADFGLTLRTEEQRGKCTGSSLYRAPEVWSACMGPALKKVAGRMPGVPDEKADIWSLAIAFFRLCGGGHPFFPKGAPGTPQMYREAVMSDQIFWNPSNGKEPEDQNAYLNGPQAAAALPHCRNWVTDSGETRETLALEVFSKMLEKDETKREGAKGILEFLGASPASLYCEALPDEESPQCANVKQMLQQAPALGGAVPKQCEKQMAELCKPPS
uniref:Protein kinase domain-containing protein n=1 Tax=Chromera velia CCMP2878 TaxID=1169474 RepID=A0A0G4I2R6_9ALVE|eukprot:Cvel_10470.t1-p1 / transcript=Cvel_10470.t1 / gene=Cvel_10470 / organism=Chromera_velia_CCMP2878 / gene_product=5'-AMP-activated protein kinase catalytic subunit, putative / transcript_product=5'-AMP-activated protein kinase catalytic subunit, putative / location=Cvel_scaffold631:44223-69017(+) / protein_length=1217 / sequence_SO=supercontig / SO=protein_coding / is_pseudo=false